MASIRLKWMVPMRGAIQWVNVSTTQIRKPVTCARNIKSTRVRRVFVAVIPAATVSTDPHVWYGSWKGRRRQRKIGFLAVFISQDLKIHVKFCIKHDARCEKILDAGPRMPDLRGILFWFIQNLTFSPRRRLYDKMRKMVSFEGEPQLC
jgi:hypothetical protein